MTIIHPEIKKQIQWVNYAKAIAIILIVYRHALTGLQDAGFQFHHFLIDANDAFMSFSMPLFMLLSGLFFYQSYKKRIFKDFIQNKISTILYPYIIWASIQLIVQIFLSKYTNHQRSFSDFSFLITNPRMLDQFWFLYALFFVTVLHAILNLWKLPKWFYLMIGLILYFIAPFFINIDILYLVSYFYIFYVLGDFLAEILLKSSNAEKLDSRMLIFLAIPLLLLSQWFYLKHIETTSLFLLIISFIGCFCMINISTVIDKGKPIKWLINVGQKSMPIYLIHVLVVAAIRVLMVKILTINNEILILVLSLIFGVYLPILFYQLTHKKFWWLYSLEKGR